MIFYHAIKGVDEKENPDTTAQELIQLIGDNCHTVVADEVLRGKYASQVSELLGKPWLLTQAADVILRVLENSAKFVVESLVPPEIPASVKVPPEDIHVVRAALISRPIVVTAEKKLLKSINSQKDLLGLSAVNTAEALELAKGE